MIKDFNTYISEGTLWGNTIMRSDTEKVRKEDELTEDDVISFVHPQFIDNCKTVTIVKIGGIPVVDIEGDFIMRKDITELPFQFRHVSGAFRCSISMISLKGCPEYVGRWFSCRNCTELDSLDGCPYFVGEDFDCRNCKSHFTKEDVEERCNVNMHKIII